MLARLEVSTFCSSTELNSEKLTELAMDWGKSSILALVELDMISLAARLAMYSVS